MIAPAEVSKLRKLFLALSKEAQDRHLGRSPVEQFRRAAEAQDITEGITGTGVRAGMLKCAIDHQGMTPGVERVMRAVAAAHHRTGVPVTVHTHPRSRSGLEVRRVRAELETVQASLPWARAWLLHPRVAPPPAKHTILALRGARDSRP